MKLTYVFSVEGEPDHAVVASGSWEQEQAALLAAVGPALLEEVQRFWQCHLVGGHVRLERVKYPAHESGAQKMGGDPE